MAQTFLAFALGLLLGIALTAAGFFLWRKQAKAHANHRTRQELQGDRVNTVAQVLHFAIQSSPGAVVVVDRKQHVVLSNPRAHELGLVHERALHEVVWEVAEEVFEHQDPQEVRFKPEGRRRGNRPVLSVAGQVQLLSLMDPRYVVVYATDDSEQVRMESARRDFVANVSHELKTPIGAMSLLVETLMEIPDDQESVQYFSSKLMLEIRRMSQMITELISLSKLQGAASLPDPEVLDVDEIVEDAFDRCRLAAEASGTELSRDADSHARVLGDLNLLVTSLSNLIANAISYSPQGTAVAVTRELTPDAVRIKVTDQGIGISEEDQKRVFERFFRVDKARSRNTGGTGLGLAIVKHVMANHGGSVSLQSQPGAGSTFTLEIPLYVPGAASRLSPAPVPDLSVFPDAATLEDPSPEDGGSR